MPGELDLQLLESPVLRWRGKVIELSSQRTIPLLAYVALNPLSVSRRDLLPMLWRDGKAVNLRQELAKIRKLPGAESWFRDDPKSAVQFRGTTDLARLTEAFEQGDFRFVCERWRDPRARYLLPGMELDFLPPQFHEWLNYEEDELANLIRLAHQRRAHEQEEAGDLAGAVTTYHQLVRLDPLAEAAHQAIIRLEVALGRPEAARHQFIRVRNVFNRELGTDPSPETIQLANDISSLAAGANVERSRNPSMQLPYANTPFVGRSRELNDLAMHFRRPGRRLVTITGLGGVGKTRLAVEFARRHAQSFSDGLLYVPLSAIERSDLMPASMAAILALPVDGETCRQRLFEYLETHSHVIVFDNAGHLPDAAHLIAEVAARSPGSHVLVTSRSALALQSEQTYTLYGMSYPDREARAAEEFEAVELFRQRSHRHLGDADLEHVSEICRLLQGLPLGIELAASLGEYLAVAEIAQELRDGNYGLLASDQRDRPVRHRTLSTLLEASWYVLEPETQAQLAKLSVFRGAFSRDDAYALAGVRFSDLRRLVDRSLVSQEQNGMIVLHHVVRWFASERLLDGSHGHRLKKKLHLLAAERIRLRRGTGAPGALEDLEPWLEQFHHLVQAAEFDEACRFLVSFDIRLLLRWGQAAMVLDLHRTLQSGLTDTNLKGRSFNSMGLALSRLGRLPEAISAYERALECCRAVNDRPNEANYLGNLGIAYSIEGRLNEAIQLHLEAIGISRELGDRRNEGIDLGCVGLAFNRLGHLERAIEYHQLALSASQEAADAQSEANHLGNLARIFSGQGDLLKAQAHVQASLALRRKLRDRRGEGIDLHCLAEIHEASGDMQRAEKQFEAALALNRAIGERIGECETLFMLGKFKIRQQRFEAAMSDIRSALLVGRAVGDRHMESEILSYLGEQQFSVGESNAAIALWLTAAANLPDRSSALAGRIRQNLSGVRHLQSPDSLQQLLEHGSDLLLLTTGVDYTFPHLELADMSASIAAVEPAGV